MSGDGSVFKKCGCRTETGKRLGATCPSLRRSNGSWHPSHGNWYYQVELPRDRQGRRRQLRRLPAAQPNDRDAAAWERDHAKALLLLAGDDEQVADEIATLLLAVPRGKPLPDRDELARRVRAGVDITIDTTVADYLTDWITKRRMDDNTRRAYRGHIVNHIIPNLGRYPLAKLSVARVEAMFDAIVARNAQIRKDKLSDDPHVRAAVKGRRPVSASTMHRIRATLRKALNDAIRKYRLIEFNPAAHAELETADLPKALLWTDTHVTHWQATGTIPSSVMVWTPQHAGAFLDYVEHRDPDLYPMFALILRRGPRRGEGCGISTIQTDLTATVPMATFTHQLSTTLGYQLVYKKVKTRSGDRNVNLDQATVADLTNYQIRREQLKAELGTAWPDTITVLTPVDGGGYTEIQVDFFFRRPDGQHWHPDLVSEKFERYVREAGLPPIGLHDARHCAATFIKAAGGDLLEIKNILGHSSITITADIYTSLLEEFNQELAENTAKIIPRKKYQQTPPQAADTAAAADYAGPI